MTALPPPFPGFEHLPSTNGHGPQVVGRWTPGPGSPPVPAPAATAAPVAPVLGHDGVEPVDPARAEAAAGATDHDPDELFPYLGRRGWRPLVVLGLLSAAVVAPFALLFVHRPELLIDLDLSAAQLDRATGVALAGVVLAAFVASLAGRATDARLLLRLSALVAGITALVGAGVADATWLGIICFVVVVFTGPLLALTRAYAYDLYGAGGGWRVGAVCWTGAAAGVAAIGAWELFATTPNWGYQLAALGAVAVVGAVLVPSDRPGPATPDDAPTAVSGERPPLAPFLALGFGAGLALVAVAPVAFDILTREWDQDRAVVGLTVLLAGLGAALVCSMAHWYSAVATGSAARLTGLAGAGAVVTATLMVTGAASSYLVGVVVSWAVAGTAAGFTAVAVESTMVSRNSPAARHYLGGALLAGVALGGLAVVAVPTLTEELGRTATMALAAVPLLVFGVLTMARYPSSLEADDGAEADPDRAEGASAVGAPAAPLPSHRDLLAIRGLDAGYEGVQVLFGVDLTVEQGEIVALMGTNGAGKTTLLRAVSGLLAPARGSITFGGVDLAALDATERVQLGMAQIAGGESLAPGLTVAENLKLFAHTLHRGKGSASRISSSIDDALAQFPRLAERRNQAASTLSGGEKQMLALAKAFVLRPRLLIIDEFSLGLAPKIVGELLPVVSRINEQGTSVLLVEQSVNVALSVARHAYFMEKGEIVFEGPADELRDQPDLLRAVYLEGITAAVGS